MKITRIFLSSLIGVVFASVSIPNALAEKYANYCVPAAGNGNPTFICCKSKQDNQLYWTNYSGNRHRTCTVLPKGGSVDSNCDENTKIYFGPGRTLTLIENYACEFSNSPGDSD